MKRDRSDRADVEPHVFDQTNGVVDLGAAESVRAEPDDGTAVRNRPVAGAAMLGVKRP